LEVFDEGQFDGDRGCSGLRRGWLQPWSRGQQDTPKSAPQEVEVTVPGEWKSRSAREEKAAWLSVKTPAKVTIKPGQVYAFHAAPDVTDEQLAGLKALMDVPLHDLTVASARMSDVGMAHIAQLSSVRYLYLSACGRVTDEGLAHLENMGDRKRPDY
jgi:hypothetical protein